MCDLFLFVCFFACTKKLALLCGAPGLGKTTLAHIIARHAGYHVVEMNARLNVKAVIIWTLSIIITLFNPFHCLVLFVGRQ